MAGKVSKPFTLRHGKEAEAKDGSRGRGGGGGFGCAEIEAESEAQKTKGEGLREQSEPQLFSGTNYFSLFLGWFTRNGLPQKGFPFSRPGSKARRLRELSPRGWAGAP